MRVETIMQNYYDNGMSGMSIHIEGTNEEIVELEREVRTMVKTRLLASSLEKTKECGGSI